MAGGEGRAGLIVGVGVLLGVGVAVRVGVGVSVRLDVGVGVSVEVGVLEGVVVTSPPPEPHEVSSNVVISKNHKPIFTIK